ncbi:flagellar basal body-associated protein FliL [Neiella marina]|uniref:Flagellar protein FliL n=1 Tax=Neiella marina TaxID=508461 RepID=A0A8J2XRW9_9GAMM|nr:flagellar basal body-associated protein FliL [Neiella marina]GGA90757.1 flagellar basal body-associated protein FliL [Neiella marina]
MAKQFSTSWKAWMLLAGLFFSHQVVAENAPAPNGDYAYFGFEPDIVTNYIRKGPSLGYIRLTAEIMVAGNKNLELVEHHAPLLRAAVVEIFGSQPEDKIKSLAGREEIRRQCLMTINDLLQQETGQPLAADILFTKYLYH